MLLAMSKGEIDNVAYYSKRLTEGAEDSRLLQRVYSSYLKGEVPFATFKQVLANYYGEELISICLEFYTLFGCAELASDLQC